MFIRLLTLTAVYPRVCGGSAGVPEFGVPDWGLSPRVRGKHRWPRSPHRRTRSIPACAGEAQVPPAERLDAEVYPRVCGGSSVCDVSDKTSCGLSPRVRGKPITAETMRWCMRSIPACAGEARQFIFPARSGRVYPRVCGGSVPMTVPVRSDWGLSPRVRGKPAEPQQCHHTHRSIPACAGEAWPPGGNGVNNWVYPRVCGGS